MQIAVLGPAGFGGSNVCVELLNRGHNLTGISRNPEKIGKHDRFRPYPLDLLTASIAQLIEAFEGQDAVINAFNPPAGPYMYRDFLETTRRLVVAAKAAKVPYFIMIGGTGSLYLGSEVDPHATCADSREFWLAYRRGVADSEAATYHMEERLGFASPMAKGMRVYRQARLALLAGKANEAELQTIKEVEDPIAYGPNPVPDLPLAARASFQMFDGNPSFRWSFVSPPGMYRPGPRTGQYEVHRDTAPLIDGPPNTSGKTASDFSASGGNRYEGRLGGITAADLGVAIADEVEKQEKVGWHWSATAELVEDQAVGSYVTLS
ncbi:hypothetical protein KC315_g16141 [Hortaea werneckii]|nr:hypothetical protein KC315_g16141 [Hortaea werneckii]KAI7336941.1 hypothetical protein KC354_g17699 [Hortaea werneckii]